jgi:hypothetical protein
VYNKVGTILFRYTDFKIVVFWIMTSCSLLGGDRRFGGTAASIFRVEVGRLKNGLGYVIKVVMSPNEGRKEHCFWTKLGKAIPVTGRGGP